MTDNLVMSKWYLQVKQQRNYYHAVLKVRFPGTLALASFCIQ